MPKFHNSLLLDVSPEMAWSVVGDLAGVTSWIPGIASAEVDGSRRVCTFADGSVQLEIISDYSADTRSFRYSVEKGPMTLKSSSGSFVVKANGAGSEVVWDSEFEVADPAQEQELTSMLEGAYKQVLDSLRSCIEG